MERFADLAAQSLNTVLEPAITPGDLEIPPDPGLGDFAFPCFKLAKQFRKAPPQVAQEIVKQIKGKNSTPKSLEIYSTGPYVNFKVKSDEALDAILGDVLKNTGSAGSDGSDGLGSYGSLPLDSRGTWVLEYSSPNTAKPFNIYHLRPTALGAALDRVGRYRGFRMVSINHLGDWGTQFGKIAVAYQLFRQDLPTEPSVQDLVSIYVKFHAASEKDPALEDQARDAFLKLEQGEPSVTAIWRQCVDIAMREFNRLYARLGVHFDHFWGESFYKDQLTPLLDSLRTMGILVQSEGAWVVPVTDESGNELPPCILQKSDGATIYATRDVAAAIYRYKQFHFDRMTYIVGGEQKLHFQQVFGVLKKMGLDWASRCEHIPTGLYRFKDAKMSTRKGNFVTLEEVLEQAKDRVKALVQERDAGLPAPELESIAEAVSVGAVIFHDLHTDPARDVEFELDRVVDFEGETGPYLQYAHTRCVSILRKAEKTGELSPKGVEFRSELLNRLQAPEEILLVKMLGRLPLHLERTLKFTKASQLATYLIDVTRAFGAFYRECHVLGEAPELTHARLMLVEATRRILARGLGLLGIPLPKRM